MIKDKFIFKTHGLDLKNYTAKFTYQLDHSGKSFEFTETLELPKFKDGGIPPQLLNNILESLHLVLGISYYKLFCPKNLVLENIKLSKAQAEFWNTVYTKGLGEFFYKNNIDFRDLIKFPYVDTSSKAVELPRTDRSLLGIGGG